MGYILGFALFTIIVVPMLYWGIRHEEERARMFGTKPNHALEIGIIAVILAVWLFVIVSWLGAMYAVTYDGT